MKYVTSVERLAADHVLDAPPCWACLMGIDHPCPLGHHAPNPLTADQAAVTHAVVHERQLERWATR